MSWEYSQHDFEVDSSEIFRPDVGNLSHVRNLADLLKSFGYNPDEAKITKKLADFRSELEKFEKNEKFWEKLRVLIFLYCFRIFSRIVSKKFRK